MDNAGFATIDHIVVMIAKGGIGVGWTDLRIGGTRASSVTAVCSLKHLTLWPSTTHVTILVILQVQSSRAWRRFVIEDGSVTSRTG